MIGAFFLSQATHNIGVLNIGTATVESSIDIIKSVRETWNHYESILLLYCVEIITIFLLSKEGLWASN